MLPKPDTCLGCPLYGDGRGWVPDEIRPDAKVFILGQNPGADEERGMKMVGAQGRDGVYEPHPPAPLIGRTGYELERTYLPHAGLAREDVSLGNVLKCRWQVGGKRTNELPTGKVLDAAVAQCVAAHLEIPVATRLVVAVGGLAAKVRGCVGSVSDWRGYITVEKALWLESLLDALRAGGFR